MKKLILITIAVIGISTAAYALTAQQTSNQMIENNINIIIRQYKDTQAALASAQANTTNAQATLNSLVSQAAIYTTNLQLGGVLAFAGVNWSGLANLPNGVNWTPYGVGN